MHMATPHLSLQVLKISLITKLLESTFGWFFVQKKTRTAYKQTKFHENRTQRIKGSALELWLKVDIIRH